MYMSHRYTGTVIHNTVISCPCPLTYECTISLNDVISYICIIVTQIVCTRLYHLHTSQLHRSLVYMCWLFLYSCCMDHCSYYMDYWYMDIPVFPLYDCFPLLILIFLLLNMWAVDIWCVELSATWIKTMRPPLESHIFCFLFPVILFHAIDRAHV